MAKIESFLLKLAKCCLPKSRKLKFPTKLKGLFSKLKNPLNPFVGDEPKSVKKVPALFGEDIFLFFPLGNSLDSVSGLQGTLISPHAQLPVLLRYKDTVLCNKARHGGPKDTSKSIDTIN